MVAVFAAMLLAVLIIPAGAQAAQEDKPLVGMLHETWLPEDGLPQSAIETLLVSSDGYLWMGTQLGLVRFNGADFELFDRYNTPAMSTSSVFDLAQAPDGTIYAALNGGGVVSLPGGTAERITILEGLSSDLVIDLDVDQAGDLWVSSLAGVECYRQGKSEPLHDPDGAPLGPTDVVLAARDGTVWVARRTGGLHAMVEGPDGPTLGPDSLPGQKVLSLLDTSEGSLIAGTSFGLRALSTTSALPPGGELLPEGLAVTCMLQGSDGALWVGTRKSGLWRVARGRAERFARPEGLSVEHVTSIAEDPEGSIWIGTHGGGLNRLRDAAVTSIPTALPWVVYEDPAQRLWFGGAGGLQRLEAGQAVDFPGREALADVVVASLLQDRDGALWIGSLGQGLRVLRDGQVIRSEGSQRGPLHDRVFIFAEGPDGAMWAGTDGGVVRIESEEITAWEQAAGLEVATVRVLHFAQDQQLWACTDGAGCYRRNDERFEAVPGGEALGASQRFVTDLHEDDEGTMWLATDGGLLRYQDGRFTTFTREHGLPEDACYRILEDDEGFLWLSGDRGVFRVAKAELARVAAGGSGRLDGVLYGKAQGMRWTECNGGSYPAGWRTAGGILWFPTTGGLVSIDPSRLRPNETVPPVHIEGLRVDGRPIPLSRTPTFPPGSRRFEFDYAALTFVGQDQVRFRVKLEGLDADWVDAGDKRSAYYHTLPPGEYTFHVIAANSDGYWNQEGDAFAFTLQPHPYQRWTVQAAAVALLLALIIGVPLVRIRRLEKRKRELADAVDQRTAELKELTLRDPLTGLRNRRFLWEVVPETIAQRGRLNESDAPDRRRTPTTLVTGFLMIDIDHFKQVNDEHGHPAGDAVLRELASLLQASVRSEDIVVRWGGEEFLVALQRTSRKALAVFSDRLWQAVAEMRFEIPDGTILHRTCSIGVCHLPFFGPGEEDLSLEHAIAIADAALYRAKETGRNRIVQVVPGPNPPTDEASRRLLQTDLGSAVERGSIQLVEPG